MYKKYDLSGMLLAIIFAAAVLVCMLLRAFAPNVILPRLDLTAFVILSLVSLTINFYVGSSSKRCYPLVLLYGILIFSSFPWAGCFYSLSEALKIGLMGGVSFAVCSVLFDLILKRLESTPASRLAPVISAFSIYLALQCAVTVL